jgi:hypothetical protein
MRLLYGFGDCPARTQAAWRKSSIRLSQWAIWFQLAGIRDAIDNAPPSPGVGLAELRHNAPAKEFHGH